MSTKRVTYQGRHTSGVFVGHESVEIPVGHGETVELDADLADKLASEQPGAFVIEPTTPPTPKKAAAKRADTSEED